MSDPTFGIGISRIDNEPRPAVITDMSVIGLVFVADDADETFFPVDTPVQFYSDDAKAITALGVLGTGKWAVELINQQLGEFEVAANIIGVRVDRGDDVRETIANLRGNSGSRTGMFALLKAGAEIGIVPRLICVPGYTAQAINQAGVLTLLTQGESMGSAPTVTFTGGGTDPDKVLPTAHAVLGTGDDADKVVALVLDSRGANLTGPVTVGFTGGGSDGDKVLPTASLTIDTASNAIVASLPSLLDQLLAVAVVDGPASTQAAALAWRATISSERIIPLETAVKVLDNDGETTVVPGSPAILGIAVRRDHEFSGRPFHSWANQAINGIVGPSRPIEFSILDGATEGQQLLSHNIGVIVRGENTDGAIANGGYIYVGTDTCSEDSLWTFYNQVRGRDYIHLLFIKTLRYFLGRRNIDRGTIEDVLNTMKFALRDIQATGDLLGFRVGFNRDANSPEQLRLGRFAVAFAAEEPPVLRYLGVQSSRYRPALDTLLSDLLTQLDVNA
jgi:phage tail sheath protein FI